MHKYYMDLHYIRITWYTLHKDYMDGISRCLHRNDVIINSTLTNFDNYASHWPSLCYGSK